VKLNKAKVGVALSTVGTALMATPVFAAADAAVVSTFTTISGNVVDTMGAVAPYGIAILAIFLGFRYGKRIFSALSKG